MAIAYNLPIDPSWYMENVIRPSGDSFGFSHPTSMGKYVFGADSFDKVFCTNLDKKGLYITDQSYKGYFDEEYKNFSGVHTQARLITFEGMVAYLVNKGIDVNKKCGGELTPPNKYQ